MITLLPLLSFLAMAAEPAAVSAGEKLFALKVQPLLAQKCFACHGQDPAKVEAKLTLTGRAGLLAGGGENLGPALVPGDAAQSTLYQLLLDDNEWGMVMPPKQNDRLTPEQAGLVREWINAGAPWPEADRLTQIREQFAHELGVKVATSGGLSDDWTNRTYNAADLWAFRPLTDPAAPPLAENPVDAFILKALEGRAIAVAPRADRRTLVRRVTFDLLGLPPTPEEVADFVADPRPDRVAFAALVDRLLASPHYGEQYARHWLDVVRYADSAGFANDYERPNAWRYRDYVVRAFQQDKPFDQFVVEQLAGDELDPADPEMLVAVGFLRMGPWEHTGMSVAKVTRQQFLDDITDAVGQAFLAQPLQCARCHDHKFDPIPTRDYYSMQAAFATTQFADRPAPFLPDENTAGFDEQSYLHTRIKTYEDLQASVKPGASPRDNGLERIAKKYLERHRRELDRYAPYAFSVYDGPTPAARGYYGRIDMPKDPLKVKGAELEQTAILTGGDPFSPAQPVAPGVLSAVAGTSAEVPSAIAGRRLVLAQWIASPDNPLTARVLVNRVWQWHFGAGLVATANNFGTMGKKPTHPELLDFLAQHFLRAGWSIKSLHRLLLNSDAYARSSSHPDPAGLAAADPLGTSYAAFPLRRLTAEELRDAMLAVSGELNPAVGGLPIRPDMNPEAALQPRQIMGTYAPAWQPSPRPEQRNRRTLYAQKLRGQRDPFLETFNQPSPDTPCEGRSASTVTPQALELFNSLEVQERAIALAWRVQQEVTAPEPAAVIDRMFLRAYGRLPSGDERRLCLAHWAAMTDRHQPLEIPRVAPPRAVTRRAVDELSGEEFDFTETLEQAADYIPDRQWADVPPATRGLAEVALVLLNSNEFAYVP